MQRHFKNKIAVVAILIVISTFISLVNASPNLNNIKNENMAVEPLAIICEDALPASVNENDGSILFSITGGSPPYTVNITGPSNFQNVYNDEGEYSYENLPPGLYEVEVVDNGGSTKSCASFIREVTIETFSICHGQILTIGDNDNSSEYCYLWGPDEEFTNVDPTLPSQAVSPSKTTIYHRTKTDRNGNIVERKFYEVEVTEPTLTVTPNSSLICSGESITLTAESGFSNYLWSNASQNSNITINTLGNYSVTATDSHGCIATASATIGNINDPVDVNTFFCSDCGFKIVPIVVVGLETTVPPQQSSSNNPIEIEDFANLQIELFNNGTIVNVEELVFHKLNSIGAMIPELYKLKGFVTSNSTFCQPAFHGNEGETSEKLVSQSIFTYVLNQVMNPEVGQVLWVHIEDNPGVNNDKCYIFLNQGGQITTDLEIVNPDPNYSEFHPFMQGLIKYSNDIALAIYNSNNLKSKAFHKLLRGEISPINLGKAYGDIGTALVAARIWKEYSTAPLIPCIIRPSFRYYINEKIGNHHCDIFTIQQLEKNYYNPCSSNTRPTILMVSEYTDYSCTYKLQKSFDLFDRIDGYWDDLWDDLSDDTNGSTVYEVKTFSPANSKESILNNAIIPGVDEVMNRFQYADAAIFAINSEAWKKIYYSTTHSTLALQALHPMEMHDNYKNENNGFFRCEDELFSEVKTAFDYIKTKFKDIDP